MEKSLWTSSEYDSMYTSGGFEGVYNLPYRNSCYYPLIKEVLAILRSYKATSVLDVGCGVGLLAQAIIEQTHLGYRGFDFSEKAIEKALLRIDNPSLFRLGDAMDISNYKWLDYNYDTIVCTEVLEHVEEDHLVVDCWEKGKLCIFSVPNFDSPSHVRFFGSEKEIINRYADFIQFHQIRRVKKPYLADNSWSNYLREIRWNRYKIKRLFALLGLASFEKAGGWFISVGRKI